MRLRQQNISADFMAWIINLGILSGHSRKPKYSAFLRTKPTVLSRVAQQTQKPPSYSNKIIGRVGKALENKPPLPSAFRDRCIGLYERKEAKLFSEYTFEFSARRAKPLSVSGILFLMRL